MDADYQALSLSGVVQDITDRKIAEQALRASEERFHQLADAMPQMVDCAPGRLPGLLQRALGRVHRL